MERVFNLRAFALLEKNIPWLICTWCMTEVFRASTIPNNAILGNILFTINTVLFLAVLLSVVISAFKGNAALNGGTLLLLAFLFLGLCILIKTKNDRTLFVVLPVFMYALRRHDFRDFTKKAACFIGGALLLVILLALIGVLPNEVFSLRGETERYTLGFTYATLSQTLMMFVALTLNYGFREKTPYWLLALEVALSCFIYWKTDTRTGFGLTLLIVFVTLAYKLIKHFKKDFALSFPALQKPKVYNVLCFFPLFLFLLFGLLVLLYALEVPLAIRINGFFSNRLLYTARAFAEQKLTLFGQRINWMPFDEYIGVDAAWYFYLFNTGIFGFLMVMIIDVLSMRHALKSRNYWLVFALFICFINGFFESYLCDIRYNVFALSLSYIANGEALFSFPKRKERNEETSL